MVRPSEIPRFGIFGGSNDAPAAGRSTALAVSGKVMLSHILASCGCRVGRVLGSPPSASINPVDEGHLKRRFVRADQNMIYRLRRAGVVHGRWAWSHALAFIRPVRRRRALNVEKRIQMITRNKVEQPKIGRASGRERV